VDCSALEKQSFHPIVNTLRVSDGFKCSLMSWRCEVEKTHPLGLALERTSSDSLGIDCRVVCSKVQCCRGCKKVCSQCKIIEGVVEWGSDVSGQEEGYVSKILETFGDWLDWVCGHPTNLGRTFPFELKRNIGSLGLGWVSKRYVLKRDSSARLDLGG
jgi:hypothetical protein